MRLSLFVLASLLFAVSNAQWQYNPYRIWNSYPDQRLNHYFSNGAYNPNYFSQQNFARSPAIAQAAPANKQQVEARFGTVTLTLTTITTTSTTTISTTCTLSTAVPSCVVSARRRRGMAPAKMLFDENDEESIFLPISPREEEVPAAAEPIQEQNVQLPAAPFVIQPGFNVPEGGAGRFLLAFGTSTVTAMATSTYSVTLTPICASTTGYSQCASG